MARIDVQLLDCTLRDGGYVNNWNWGFQTARSIVSSLIRAKVEVVELGFLRNVSGYNPDITVCNCIEDLNKLIPADTGNTIFSGMAMCSNYDIRALSSYYGKGIELIRITAHDYDLQEGLDFAVKVKDKGYKLAINPINIMGYSDYNILKMLEKVNDIQPFQFSVVDTFGSMKRRDLDRTISLIDNNLDDNIRVGLHLHENMSIACYLAQLFVDKRINRPIAIDASLMGMGRTPGNLPIELISDYLNDVTYKTYDIDFLLDAIWNHIYPLKGHDEWGYNPVYFLSARHNIHRNYAEHYLSKGDLTHRDIDTLFSHFDTKKKSVFDSVYADTIYFEYKDHTIDDEDDWKCLNATLKDKDILIVAPGKTIVDYQTQIDEFIRVHKPIVISLNFVPTFFNIDFAFFSNSIRYNQVQISSKSIITSNIKGAKGDYNIDYIKISLPLAEGCNSLLLLLNLLFKLKASQVFIAGADGYSSDKQNYYDSSIRSSICHDKKFNCAVKDAIGKLGLSPIFVTPSEYENS